MLNRSKTWAGMVLLAAFVSGLVVGGAATTAWATRRVHRVSFAERLQGELSLTAVQRDSVDAILKTSQAPLVAAWESFQPARDAYRASRDSIFGVVRGRIAAQLTPEQRQRYQELNARADSVRRAHESPPTRNRDSAATHAR
jgi:Spy/CpxP family protein refolding chaperone